MRPEGPGGSHAWCPSEESWRPRPRPACTPRPPLPGPVGPPTRDCPGPSAGRKHLQATRPLPPPSAPRRPTSSVPRGSIRPSPLLLAGKPARDPLPSQHSHTEPSLWGFPRSVPAGIHRHGRNFYQGSQEACRSGVLPLAPPHPQRPGQVRGRWGREAPGSITYPYWDTRHSAAPHTLGHPIPPQGPSLTLLTCSTALRSFRPPGQPADLPWLLAHPIRRHAS